MLMKHHVIDYPKKMINKSAEADQETVGFTE